MQGIAAVLFLVAGGIKLAGVPETVQAFEAIGAGQCFRYVTGLLEVTGAALLVVPGFAAWGAVLLAVVMVGAVFAHLAVLGGSSLLALALLVAVAVIAWGRRYQLARPRR